jgi:HSP20 family protein
MLDPGMIRLVVGYRRTPVVAGDRRDRAEQRDHREREVVVMTVFFDPFREMDRLSRELLGQRAQGGGPRWMPMDLYREGDHFVANIDLPGVDPGSIDIDVEGSTLTIRAQRTFRSEDAEWLSQERPSGTFMRQMTLGEGVDVENIHADYENGVLSLTVPVAAGAKPRKIQVEAGRGEPRQIGRSEESMQDQTTEESAQQ